MPDVDEGASLRDLASLREYLFGQGTDVPTEIVAASEPPLDPERCTCHGCCRSRGEQCNCEPCRIRRGEEVWLTCTNCGNDFQPPRSNAWGAFCDESCYNEYFGLYSDDDDDDGPSDYVHGYSYRPSVQFKAHESEANPNLFFGFELEVPTDEPNEVAEVLYNGVGDSENLLYCKEDGSIQGVEIVSHPMTHKYFRECFPFDMFKARREPTTLLRRREPPEGYGLHVHVSRAGFDDEAHVLRWLLLIYRNQDAMEALSRRTAAQWANFQDYGRCEEKARNITRDRYSGDTYPYYEGERYVAVNAQNRDTFEIRVFRSTWNEQQFRAAIDFAHASVEYTRTLTGESVTQGDGLSFTRFRAWAAEREEYASLTAELDKVLPEIAANVFTFTHEEEALLCAC